MKKSLQILLVVLTILYGAWLYGYSKTGITDPVELLDIATNYTSQQIDNWTFRLSDSTQAVRLKSVAPGVIIPVTISNTVDTGTFFWDSTVTVADTIELANYFNTRVELSFTPFPGDSLLFTIHSDHVDSVLVYPGAPSFRMNYFDPFRKDTIIIYNRNPSGRTGAFQMPMQGI